MAKEDAQTHFSSNKVELNDLLGKIPNKNLEHLLMTQRKLCGWTSFLKARANIVSFRAPLRQEISRLLSQTVLFLKDMIRI